MQQKYHVVSLGTNTVIESDQKKRQVVINTVTIKRIIAGTHTGNDSAECPGSNCDLSGDHDPTEEQ